MTITDAIRIAKERVSVVPFGGRQYVIHEWDPSVNATRQSNPTTREWALMNAYEAKVRIALTLLGVDFGIARDTAYLAAETTPRKDWRAVVRAEARVA